MAELSPETLQFVSEHRTDDVRKLALQAARYPRVDMSEALTQIAGRQMAREKLPSWAEVEGVLYPPHLSMEQCSSEATARYKAEVVSQTGIETEVLTDLTGGFGIDFAALAPLFGRADYVERQATLCELARHNFPLLGLPHARVLQADGVKHLQEMPNASFIFIDPARRDGHGGKTVAIADCEPDVSLLEPLLVRKAHRVLVKLSPMLDLSLALRDLRHVCRVDVVSLNGECKELLLMLDGLSSLPAEEVPIHTVNLTSTGEAQRFSFTRASEHAAPCPTASTPDAYLYEPNASLLKAGAFRCLCPVYGVKKLHANSHLYTSEHPVPGFPGRRFHVLAHSGFGKKEVRALLSGVTRANLTVRNFPASVAELRKRLKLADGGDLYLFATTLDTEERVLLLCKKVV